MGECEVGVRAWISLSKECSGDWQNWLRVSGCPRRVGGVWVPGPECENVSASECLSPVWLGCGCLLLRLDLASRSSPRLPPTPPHSWDRLLAFPLSATGASLACSWNLERRRRRKRQADRPPTLQPACLASWGNEIGSVELRFPWLPQTLQHTSQSARGGQVLREGAWAAPHLLPPEMSPSTQHSAHQGPYWDLQAPLSAWGVSGWD